MPELPEVEVVRRGLEPHIVDHAFKSVEILHPRANRGQDEPLGALLHNRVVSAIARRGKYLWCELDGHTEREDDVLFMHLGMSGQLRIGHTDSKHVRIRAHLTDGVDLSFIDQRTFGYWLVAPKAKIDHIGHDPLSPDFDIVAAARKLRTKSRMSKPRCSTKPLPRESAIFMPMKHCGARTFHRCAKPIGYCSAKPLLFMRRRKR